jgi:hypothetical protein
MNYVGALIGLVFVTILFNFSYPQNALELLLRVRQELGCIRRDSADYAECEDYLQRAQGWFFFTDFIQFVAAYFVGFFVTIFTLFNISSQVMGRAGLIASMGASGVIILAYVLLWKRSIGRVEGHGGDGAFTDRTTWLRGLARQGVFRSSFPRRAFLGLFVITLAALVFAIVTGFRFEAAQTEDLHRVLTLSVGILVVVAIYLVNFWGLFVYMPYSSVAEIQDRALRAAKNS